MHRIIIIVGRPVMSVSSANESNVKESDYMPVNVKWLHNTIWMMTILSTIEIIIWALAITIVVDIWMLYRLQLIYVTQWTTVNWCVIETIDIRWPHNHICRRVDAIDPTNTVHIVAVETAEEYWMPCRNRGYRSGNKPTIILINWRFFLFIHFIFLFIYSPFANWWIISWSLSHHHQSLHTHTHNYTHQFNLVLDFLFI